MREYLESPLTSALIQGKKYCIEFFIALANSSQFGIDSIGLLLSTDSVLDTSGFYPLLSYSPMLAGDSCIADTNNWIKISGTYTALGGEKFIVLGNFNNNTNTDTCINIGSGSGSYYYVDDVSVYLCDTVPAADSTIFVPNAFSPNADGENDVFKVNGDIDELHCYIFNRWGEPVAELNLPKEGWDGRANGMECQTGVYFYYLIAKDKQGKEILKKGNITLLR